VHRYIRYNKKSDFCFSLVLAYIILHNRREFRSSYGSPTATIRTEVAVRNPFSSSQVPLFHLLRNPCSLTNNQLRTDDSKRVGHASKGQNLRLTSSRLLTQSKRKLRFTRLPGSLRSDFRPRPIQMVIRLPALSPSRLRPRGRNGKCHLCDTSRCPPTRALLRYLQMSVRCLHVGGCYQNSRLFFRTHPLL
jgi:hypothetical protein